MSARSTSGRDPKRFSTIDAPVPVHLPFTRIPYDPSDSRNAPESSRWIHAVGPLAPALPVSTSDAALKRVARWTDETRNVLTRSHRYDHVAEIWLSVTSKSRSRTRGSGDRVIGCSPHSPGGYRSVSLSRSGSVRIGIVGLIKGVPQTGHPEPRSDLLRSEEGSRIPVSHCAGKI